MSERMTHIFNILGRHRRRRRHGWLLSENVRYLMECVGRPANYDTFSAKINHE